MSNQLEITNLAILMLGEEELESVNDKTKIADIAKAFFNVCLETALSEHNWTFARKLTVLSSDTIVPAFGYSARFLLPPDYNHICIEETDEQVDFREQNGYIHQDAETINLTYIANITDLSVLKPKFVDAVAALLASYIAFAITSKEKLSEHFERLYEKKIQKAKGQDGFGIGLVDDITEWTEDR